LVEKLFVLEKEPSTRFLDPEGFLFFPPEDQGINEFFGTFNEQIVVILMNPGDMDQSV
jgi:hypothetical protein